MSLNQSFEGLQLQTLSYYETNAGRFFEDTRKVDMSLLYKPFLSRLPVDGHILDAGCGSGRDSLFFLRKGYEVTALDASEALANLASQYISRPVLRMSFDQIEFEDCFDGVWACASLLHIPRRRILEVFDRLSRSLKPSGVLYASFKYGDEEGMRDGRFFSNYREDSFRGLLQGFHDLEAVQLWRTNDSRSGRCETTWLNVLLQKK